MKRTLRSFVVTSHVFAYAPVLLSLAACDGGSTSEAAPPMRRQPKDAEPPEAGTQRDGGVDTEDAGPDGCETDRDCDDHKFCDGSERCVEGHCREAERDPCVLRSMCSEQTQRCDCDFDRDGVVSARCGGPDCDEDRDNHDAIECRGDDCDDANSNRYTGNAEICDPAGVDEDCSFETVAGASRDDDPINYDRHRDQDDDGAMNGDCRNFDPVTAHLHFDPSAERDCNDQRDTISPAAGERCDTVDNDCDGLVDEVDGSGVPLSQQQEFCFDKDRDGYGNRAERGKFCQLEPGWAPCRLDEKDGGDCDDSNPNAHPGHKVLEVCDGVDNDCDGKIDQDDRDVDPLPDQLSSLGSGTDLVCREGRWWITACPEGRDWCDDTTVVKGCETDIRKLTSCRSCSPTSCLFACGENGCDEVVQVAAGYEHACARTAEGLIACWGRGSDGRLGNDDIVSSAFPVEVARLPDRAREVALGYQHTCAVVGDERALYCWGSNGSNQLGSPDGSPSHNPSPVPVAGLVTDRLRGITHAALGADHSCALANTGEVYCWGEAGGGRLGDGSTGSGPSYRRYVVRSDNLQSGVYQRVMDAVALESGDEHACLVTAAGALECWGNNSFGQLGDPAIADTEFISYARPVPGILNPVQISLGDFHSCAVVAGSAMCWGLNDHLQLGRPSDERDGEPLAVPGVHDVVEIAAGVQFTCARTARNEVYCWGAATRLTGEDTDLEPYKVELPNARSLATGGLACALTGQTDLHCWGPNFYGQVGTGSTSRDVIAVPFSVKPLARNW